VAVAGSLLSSSVDKTEPAITTCQLLMQLKVHQQVQAALQAAIHVR